jgi:signal transduction histidine kinase
MEQSKHPHGPSTGTLYRRVESAADEHLSGVLTMLAAAAGTRGATLALLDEGRRAFSHVVAPGTLDAAVMRPLWLYALNTEGVAVVPDVQASPTFAAIPGLAAAPRLFAGVRVQGDEGPAGVLCVTDDGPGEPARLGLALEGARRAVEAYLTLRRDLGALQARHADHRREIAGLHGELGATATLKHHRDALAAANVDLGRSVRLKDEFISGMSRELRTPLNAVLGLAEALEEGVYGALNDAQRRAVAGIRGSGRQLLALDEDVLDLFKAEAHRLSLTLRPLPVAALCRACLAAVQDDAHRHRLALSLQLEGELGSIDGDELRVSQILVALWRSAIECASEGGAVGLRAAPDPGGDAVRFTVWDTGVGLSSTTQARFFQEFGEPDGGPPSGRSGTGVGLALARRLAELHGGQILVESEAGIGTRRTVTLPRQHASVRPRPLD